MSIVQNIVHGIKQSAFLQHNLIFFSGAVAVGGLNYLFYPIIGRLLEPSSFGEVQVLISLFLQLTIFLTVLGLVTVNITANYDNKLTRNEAVYELEKVGLLISLFILALTVAGSELLKQFLHFDASLPFVLLAVALVITVPFTFRSSYMRGQRQFGQTAIANLISAGGKLLFAVVFVLLGFGVNGAILGLVIAQLLAFLYTRYHAKKTGLDRRSDIPLFAWPRVRRILPELRFSLFVFIGSLAIMLLLSADVIIVKHFFDAHTAGLYAGIATAARMIFFVTASVAQVMLPSIKIEQTAKQNQSLLIKSLILLTMISLPILILFLLFPQFVIHLLMGAEYLQYANLLPLLGCAILIISLLNLLVSYFLALRSYIPALIAMIGAIAVALLMIVSHDDLQVIVNALFYGTIGTASAMILWVFFQKANRRTA